MSVSVATSPSAYSNTWSLGPLKIQLFDIAHVTGDTTCVVTGDRMSRAVFGILASSVVQTTAPAYSGAGVTFTFTDPAATVKGQCILLGI
jgi:hypothetical protein